MPQNPLLDLTLTLRGSSRRAMAKELREMAKLVQEGATTYSTPHSDFKIEEVSREEEDA